ncbi:ExbD/TolR family protein [Pseudaestuariivita rosea]|uniref:ExbD/TolR family protein n=1 Tax=Pseudaestuariivita rosea TaxID=2763263 RepID=UPI001ABB4657|nr:biopolymer transporter ExbD [Pseudaestuariivita rosea]
MRRHRARRKAEPTIALINIVFLMLVFFMAAGTLSKPLDGDVQLVSTDNLDGAPPPDTLVIHRDGRLSYDGQDQASVQIFLSNHLSHDQSVLRILPDRELPAQDLVRITQVLQAAGFTRVLAVTERGLQ